jgi:hypothetical protein
VADLYFECDRCGLCCRRLLIEAGPGDVVREPRISEGPEKGRPRASPLLEQCWYTNDTVAEAQPGAAGKAGAA